MVTLQQHTQQQSRPQPQQQVPQQQGQSIFGISHRARKRLENALNACLCTYVMIFYPQVLLCYSKSGGKCSHGRFEERIEKRRNKQEYCAFRIWTNIFQLIMKSFNRLHYAAPN